MFKLFSAFRKDKVWDFNGGIHPPEMKTQSNGTPLRQVSLPQRLIIPLKQHIGAEGELCVKVGDRVLRGQPLTRGWGRMLPVHAPTSGTVAAIAPQVVESGIAGQAVGRGGADDIFEVEELVGVAEAVGGLALGEVDLDAGAPGPARTGAGLAGRIAATPPPSPRLWDRGDTGASWIGIRVDAPLADPARAALRLAAAEGAAPLPVFVWEGAA